MLNIGVLVSGGGSNLQAIIDAVEKQQILANIATVVSSNPKAFALERARLHGISFACIPKTKDKSQKEYDAQLISHLQKYKVDLVVTAGFLVILGSDFVRMYHHRIMNVHPSLIPSFSGKGFHGMKVHEAVLLRGVKVTGATVHMVTEETDAGPIVLQKAVCVAEDDTPETLQKRVMQEAEWVILPQAIALFAKGLLQINEHSVRILTDKFKLDV